MENNQIIKDKKELRLWEERLGKENNKLNIIKYKVDNRILHIIYNKKGKDDVIFKKICEISKRYEGTDNSNFIGFNFYYL